MDKSAANQKSLSLFNIGPGLPEPFGKRRYLLLAFVAGIVLLLAVGFSIGFAVFPSLETVDMGNYVLYMPWGGIIGLGIAFLQSAAPTTGAHQAGCG